MTACGPAKEVENSGSGQMHTCPMHPQIVQDGPGSCPICGMDLVPAGQSGSEQEIMLSERQVKLAGIEVDSVRAGGIGGNTFLTGRLKADQELVHTAGSRVPGRIERLYIKETGKPVSKGQSLYTIYSEQLLSLQKEYLLAREQYLQLGKDQDRYASFMEAAKKKLLLYGMTASQITDLTESKTFSPSVTFLSPASGVVTEITVSEGQYVAEGSRLYTIGGLSRLWAEAELYPSEASRIKQGEQVQVIVGGFENEPIRGKVVFLAPQYRAGTQILTLRAAIPNPGGALIPGMQARLVLSEDSAQALVLPSGAVIREEKGSHVWIKTGEGTFAPRKVKTGMESFDKIAITDGLREGDLVVTSGAYLLYSELILKKGQQPMAAMEM